MIKKPILAASMEIKKTLKGGKSITIKKSFSDLTYPLLASIKLDGIRAIKENQKVLSRSFKNIPNKYVQETMASLPDGLDGELITYNKDGSVRTFNEIQSDIMSRDGEPDFKFAIFDYVAPNGGENKAYQLRYQYLKDFIMPTLPSYCLLVDQVSICNEQELKAYEDQVVAAGHEGVMVRSFNDKYKFGRCTFNEQNLIKIKRFEDSEAIIIGFKEKMHNENEAEVDELGHTKRSSAKAGLVPAGTLGTLLVRDYYDGREFGIGTYKGLTKEDLQEIWNNQDKYLGKIVKYQWQVVGTKDNPRIPSFQGFRDEGDMSE